MLAILVVAVGVIGLEDTQPILDRQARRADQEAACEMLAGRAPHRIDRLPSDKHGHDSGLPCAGGEFQRKPQQLGIGISVRRRQMIE